MRSSTIKPSLSFLNIFEVATDGVTHHLICFLDPILAGVKGIDSRWTVGEFTPGPDGGFDPASFRPNPDFVATFGTYMNEVAAHAPEIAAQAAPIRSAWLYVVDPRHPNRPEVDPPPEEVLGCFAVDETGQIVPRSFQYNANHAWFDSPRGVSGVFSNREFYRWLHPARNHRDS